MEPVALFETAESLRDDDRTDKVNVLATYWDASLQAKALLMLFGRNGSGPVPDGGGVAGM